jgi:hypothetical protein
MALAGVGLIGNGIVFLARNVAPGPFLEMGIGVEQVGATPADIRAFSPDLFNYITHLHYGISGFLIGAGVALGALAWYGVRQGLRWSWWTAVVTFAVVMVVGMPAHYSWGFANLGHIGGAYLATGLFVVGAVLTASVARAAWRTSGLGAAERDIDQINAERT